MRDTVSRIQNHYDSRGYVLVEPPLTRETLKSPDIQIALEGLQPLLAPMAKAQRELVIIEAQARLKAKASEGYEHERARLQGLLYDLTAKVAGLPRRQTELAILDVQHGMLELPRILRSMRLHGRDLDSVVYGLMRLDSVEKAATRDTGVAYEHGVRLHDALGIRPVGALEPSGIDANALHGVARSGRYVLRVLGGG